MHPDKERNSDLATAEARYRGSIEDMLSVAKAVQGVCPHRLIYHMVDRAHRYDHRICLRCGLEEVGSHWSSVTYWNVSPGPTLLGNNDDRIVLQVEPDEFYRHRVQHQPMPPPYGEPK